jgi:hypothetical protein
VVEACPSGAWHPGWALGPPADALRAQSAGPAVSADRPNRDECAIGDPGRLANACSGLMESTSSGIPHPHPGHGDCSPPPHSSRTERLPMPPLRLGIVDATDAYPVWRVAWRMGSRPPSASAPVVEIPLPSTAQTGQFATNMAIRAPGRLANACSGERDSTSSGMPHPGHGGCFSPLHSSRAERLPVPPLWCGIIDVVAAYRLWRMPRRTGSGPRADEPRALTSVLRRRRTPANSRRGASRLPGRRDIHRLLVHTAHRTTGTATVHLLCSPV